MTIIPQNITQWEDSNIVHNAELFNPLTTYGVGDFARVDKYVYRSTLASNIGNNPLTSLGLYWIEWEPANDYAMLDLDSDKTVTTWTGDGWVKFRRGAATALGIGFFKANIVKIEYLDNDNTVLNTENYEFTNNAGVWDVWTYGYGGFNTSTNEVIFLPLRIIGTYIKVSFINTLGGSTYCGFFIAGVAEEFGTTIDGVRYTDKLVSNRSLKIASFSSYFPKTEMNRKYTTAQKYKDDYALVVIDDSTDSKFNFLTVLGKITKIEPTFEYTELNQIFWEVEQTAY